MMFNKMKKTFMGILAASLMIPTGSALAVEHSGVYNGVTYTVSATCGINRGSGYGRYVDTSKGLDLIVTFTAKNYSGNWESYSARQSGTTYVTATTARMEYVDQATKSTTSKLWIAGQWFEAIAR